MARLRTWAEWEKLEGADALTPAERHLVDCCKTGEGCILGDGTRPDAPSPERSIRAALLRYLILGGCEACRTDEWGVRLVGAYVTGKLDISFSTARGFTALVNCCLTEKFYALQTRLEFLNLTGSAFFGLVAQGALVSGGFFLNGAKAIGEINLYGAQIIGPLSCESAQFSSARGKALNAQGATMACGVFLNCLTARGEINFAGAQISGQLSCAKARLCNPKGFAFNAQGTRIMDDIVLDETEATGEVSFSGAQISGQLSCAKATFCNPEGTALSAQGAVTGDIFLTKAQAEGVVLLSGARICGQLECSEARFRKSKGRALNAQRLHVAQGLIWQQVEVSEGSLYFASAHVSDLADEPESWPCGGRIDLDGFTYDRISGAFIDAPRRLEWLRRGTRWEGEFFPQPYTQLAKVLREMGHDRAARRVLMERECLIRRQARKDARKASKSNLHTVFRRCFVYPATWLGASLEFLFLQHLTGYGYQPWRSLVALLALFLAATFLADRAWTEGSFAPNSGPVLVSEDWKAYDARDCLSLNGAIGCLPNPAASWSAEGAPGADWDSFNPLGYAADLVIPILDLGQTAAWAPSKDRGPWGWGLWWGRWLLSASGWIVTALGAAAVTGIIRQDRG
ncbi:hypothetical protein [Rhodobacteraceae bacterium DSL-40]|uniref:hypothetical protein n=1 Tax=Amaricoccus sp. B4 TaxID=3368557 RepID=UPI000DABCC1F